MTLLKEKGSIKYNYATYNGKNLIIQFLIVNFLIDPKEPHTKILLHKQGETKFLI